MNIKCYIISRSRYKYFRIRSLLDNDVKKISIRQVQRADLMRFDNTNASTLHFLSRPTSHFEALSLVCMSLFDHREVKVILRVSSRGVFVRTLGARVNVFSPRVTPERVFVCNPRRRRPLARCRRRYTYIYVYVCVCIYIYIYIYIYTYIRE